MDVSFKTVRTELPCLACHLKLNVFFLNLISQTHNFRELGSHWDFFFSLTTKSSLDTLPTTLEGQVPGSRSLRSCREKTPFFHFLVGKDKNWAKIHTGKSALIYFKRTATNLHNSWQGFLQKSWKRFLIEFDMEKIEK